MSTGPLDLLRDAGQLGYLMVTLALGFTVVGAIAVARGAAKKGSAQALAAIAFAGGLAIVVLGVVNRKLGQANIERALSAVDPSQRAAIARVGASELDSVMKLACGAAALPILLGVAALFLAGRDPKAT